jgi:Lrp/AsnC family leucine-responsive transcriptional regulator
MDAIDYQILRCLKENSRENATTIGNKINLSTSAVIERIKKLEASGIIKQYTAIIDHEQIGRDITAFISVRLEHPKYNDTFTEMVLKNDEIVECYYIAGDFDFMVKVITESRKGLEGVLNYIKGIDGVSLTRTIVVLSIIKNEVSLLPETDNLK